MDGYRHEKMGFQQHSRAGSSRRCAVSAKTDPAWALNSAYPGALVASLRPGPNDAVAG
jgi:hypothetical protein